MAGIEQVLIYVKQINERLNQWSANAKKTEELPAMEIMDPEGLLIVSELVSGVYTSKKLQIQKIIDGISLSGQDNKVREVLLGTITDTHDLNYLLDNTGITVTENEIVMITALATVNSTLIQKQYLWKLGKGAFNPIGSANSNTKIIELQPRFLSEITAEELTSSPSAIVYDFGTITDSILNILNTASPARNYTDTERIYYIRATKDGENLLYNFIGVNGTYGAAASQMTNADLVLVYSSANTDISQLLNNKVDKVTGYSLTKNDLTDLLKTAYDNAVTWISTNGTNLISHLSRTDNPHGLTKTQVGLGNADNTSDLSKPVSTAQAAADAFVLASGKTYSDGLITQLINGAPADGNTLKELNDKILAIQSIVGGTTADGDAIVNTVSELLAVFATFPEGVDLVTLLAGKVNTADVYNALDCIVAGKVADARQLKVLNDLITTLRTDLTANTTAIGLRELSSNKSQDIEADKTSTTKYGSVKAFYDWAVAKFQLKLVSGTNLKTINGQTLLGSTDITISAGNSNDVISYALSAPTTNLVTGDVDTFHAPYNFTLVSYWIGVKVAPTVSSILVDVKKNGTSITSTKAGIDATEFTSLTGIAPVLTTTAFVKGDAIVPVISQIGSSETGKSLKIYLEVIKT